MRSVSILAVLILMMVVPILYAAASQSPSAWWRQQDASVRMAPQNPDEQTRSAAQPQITIPISSGGSGDPINWSEMLAMLGVFSGVVGGIQWVVVRILIDPMIRNHTSVMQRWAEEKFPTSKEFEAHARSDDAHQQRMEKEVDQLWERLNKS